MDEQQFKKEIIKLRALARKQGEKLSKQQIKNSLVPLDVNEGHFILIYDYLKEEKVELYETEEERLASEDTHKSVRINRDDSDYLKMYLEDLEAFDPLKGAGRSELIESVLNDRSRAYEILPALYLKEVVDTARLYAGQGVPIEDLIGEGNVGVMSAAGMLDLCETVAEVEEFMMRMIMDSMESLIIDNLNLSDFDLRVADRVNDLNDKAKEMAEELERLVTVEELARELELTEEYINETIRLSGNSIGFIKGCKNN